MSGESVPNLSTLLGPGATAGDNRDAEVGRRLCTSDVRRSGGVRTFSFAVTVVLGLSSVGGRAVFDNDDRSNGGLALVVSIEPGSGRVR